MKRYQAIARVLSAIGTCKKRENAAWLDCHEDRLHEIMSTAPSGSGIDAGTKLDDSSTKDKLVFAFGYHHMDEHGYYDGWTEHTAVVKPSMCFGYDLRITGRDRNGIKEYLASVFDHWLNEEQA